VDICESPPHNQAMEVRHLRYFTAVASELHFARAAERLNISPPTLTQQIKWLESHLGVKLFNRSGTKKVELTFAGQQFQKRALALVESFDQAERFARAVARGAVGDVRMGYVMMAATAGYIKRIIETVRATLPNVLLHIQRMETISQLKALSSGRLDIGVIRSMDSYPSGITAFSIGRQRLCLAAHRDHPLSKKKQVTAEDLAKHKFVAYELDAEIGFWRNLTAFVPARTIPQIVQHVPDATSLLALVSANVGVAIVQESFRNIVDPSVVIRNISATPKYSLNVVVCRENEPSPAVQGVIKTLRTEFRSL
jgi:DNA-binding transcriptional LysR family regulator